MECLRRNGGEGDVYLHCRPPLVFSSRYCRFIFYYTPLKPFLNKDWSVDLNWNQKKTHRRQKLTSIWFSNQQKMIEKHRQINRHKLELNSTSFCASINIKALGTQYFANWPCKMMKKRWFFNLIAKLTPCSEGKESETRVEFWLNLLSWCFHRVCVSMFSKLLETQL